MPWQKNWQDKEETKWFKCRNCGLTDKSQQKVVICPICSNRENGKVYMDEC